MKPRIIKSVGAFLIGFCIACTMFGVAALMKLEITPTQLVIFMLAFWAVDFLGDIALYVLRAAVDRK